MHARLKTGALWALLVAGVLLAVAVGYSLAMLGATGSSSVGTSRMDAAYKSAESIAPQVAGDALAGAPQVTGEQPVASSTGAETAAADRLVISTASMAIEVDDVDTAVEAVRTLIADAGGQIADLSIQAGEPEPIPLASGTSDAQPRTPSSAMLTVRVPADKLESIQAQAAKLGVVLSQTASETDVTQQHVDLSARLTNLRAEEARLREFLSKATKVSEMLEVERELARVRGDIESMQAQVEYLERQAAMATLTLSLTAPGAVVRPDGTDWGFGEAVTRGVQAAAALLGALITVTIALAPVIVLVIVVVFAVRAVRKRRRARAASAPEAPSAGGDIDDAAQVSPTSAADRE